MHLPARIELERRPLTTARLVIAPLDGDDARDFLRAVDVSRAHLAPWLSWVDACTSSQDALAWCDAAAHDWDGARALRFGVREANTLQLLGVVALEALVPAHDNADLVVWLRAEAVRHGFATEAAAAVLTLAFRRAGFHRVRAVASTSNTGAMGVLHRLGFRFEAVVRGVERRAGRWVDEQQHALLARDPFHGPWWAAR
jgi:RimJ/RimL family protein N-acetyltransferase